MLLAEPRGAKNKRPAKCECVSHSVQRRGAKCERDSHSMQRRGVNESPIFLCKLLQKTAHVCALGDLRVSFCAFSLTLLQDDLRKKKIGVCVVSEPLQFRKDKNIRGSVCSCGLHPMDFTACLN